MLGVVIVGFVLFQALEHKGRAGDVQAVGADDDQDHRREEQQDGLQGALDRQGDVVARAQGQHAEDQDQPFDFGLLFPRAGRGQQLHRLQAADRDAVDEEGQAVQGQEDQHRVQQGGRVQVVEARHNVHVEQPADQQAAGLVHQGAEEQPQDDGDQRGDQGLGEQHPDDVALLHAQHVVHAEFVFALLHQEAVDIQDQDEGQQPDDEGPEGHEHGQVGPAQGLGEPSVQRQGEQDVEAAQQTRLRQDAGDVQPVVLADVLRGDPGIKTVFHGPHLPVRSMVRVSEIFLYRASLLASPR